MSANSEESSTSPPGERFVVFKQRDERLELVGALGYDLADELAAILRAGKSLYAARRLGVSRLNVRKKPTQFGLHPARESAEMQSAEDSPASEAARA